jgi:membrane-bound serine protease (ClpP class)
LGRHETSHELFGTKDGEKVKTLLLLFCLPSLLWAAEMAPVLTVADSINPGTGDYLVNGIEEAEKARVPYLVIHLDTPGGLLSTTRLIVQKMLASTVPIVVFVGPRGAHAGSAGALITFAADIAAMAPATNIGAAHPVVAGGGETDKTMATKMVNDTAAFAESVAKARGRNTTVAIQTVRASASLIADQALAQGVIDLIAEDLPDLRAKLTGFRLRVARGSLTTLPAQTVELTPRPMALKYRIVSFFADPNLAYLIMSLGALCLWIELTHPGMILPGAVGTLCILVSMVSFQLLPISYGALALIFVGLGFIVAELFLPTYGILGVAGMASFIFGSLFLMDTTAPQYQVSLKLIFPTAAALSAAAVWISLSVLRAQKRRHLSGTEALVGELGQVRETVSESKGKVFVQGELWNAKSETGATLSKGSVVVVRQVDHLELVVAEKV